VGPLSDTSGVSVLTVSAWIYQESLSEGSIAYNERDIVSYWGFEASDTWGGNDEVAVFLSDASNTHWGYTTNGAHGTNSWEHWVFVYNGSLSGNSNRLKVYKNGATQSLTFFGTIPASITGHSGSPYSYIGGGWNGRIDDVRIYTRALTATEVMNLYNMGK